MTVTSREIEEGKIKRPQSPITGRRGAAVIAQIASFITTWLFIDAIGVTGYIGFGIALVVEYLLIQAKTLTLSSNRPDALGVFAIALDGVLNAGGMWPYILRLHHTPPWLMFVAALGLEGELRQVPALIITLVAGLLLAVLPHRLWRAK